MRELGFKTMWDKLGNDILFTTFRFPRKDSDRGRDWAIEEVVKIVFKPRSKTQRKVLGVARIIRKETKDLTKNFYDILKGPVPPDIITPEEAYNDGFVYRMGGGDVEKMVRFFHDTYGYAKCRTPINKLTLYWIKKEVELPGK